MTRYIYNAFLLAMTLYFWFGIISKHLRPNLTVVVMPYISDVTTNDALDQEI